MRKDSTTKTPRYRTNKAKLRRLLYKRDKGICYSCHRHIPFHDFEVGHLVDRELGGSDELENLAVMCSTCNHFKPAHTTIEEARSWSLKSEVLRLLERAIREVLTPQRIAEFKQLDTPAQDAFCEAIMSRIPPAYAEILSPAEPPSPIVMDATGKLLFGEEAKRALLEAGAVPED